MTATASTISKPQLQGVPASAQSAHDGARDAAPQTPAQPRRRPLTAREVKAATWSHFGPALAIAVGVVIWPIALLVIGIPLYFRLTAGNQSRDVRDQSTAALNFVVTALVALGLALAVLVIFGTSAALLVVPAILAFFVLQIALLIKAGKAAKVGKRYRYPFTIRILR
jgi:uncharacterized Tic20 family protein